MIDLEYVRNTIDGILAEKQAKGITPVACTKIEVMEEIGEAVSYFMNQLLAGGEYRAYYNINKIPLITRNTKQL